MNENIQTPNAAEEQSGLPYTHCLNCGTELKGVFCHSCGQEAVDVKPTVKGLLMAFLDNAWMIDSQFLRTVWTLVRRPGQLTCEYNEGKFISQQHPLKLNMFLLFIFVTLFVFFGSGDQINDSVHGLRNNEQFFSGIVLSTLSDNAEYVTKMQESPRDTVLLQAPMWLATKYPEILTNIETREDAASDELDIWVATLPQLLIEDDFIKLADNGCYHFNTEVEMEENMLDVLIWIWDVMADITSRYFPMLLLLTTPFLSFALRLVQRKSGIPTVNHFIFALHYTAFLEVLMITIYVLHLTIAPPMSILEHFMNGGTILYLFFAFRRVYANTWPKAAVKSLLTNMIYFSILLLIFMVIFFIACCIVVAQLDIE